jgi:plastocyanin
MRRTIIGFIGAVLVLAGCGSAHDNGMHGGAVACDASTATATASVAIQGYSYVPACVKVTSGTLVTFTNDDGIPHTVTTDAGQAESFDSGAIASSGTFTHTFTAVGTDALHCTFHTGMHMTVLVQ